MCCGILFTEFMFLGLYVLTAPALTASSGPHLLLHLYLIYTGYTFLGAALSRVSPFLREVIQVCVCGVVLVCYPLTLVPEPLLDLLATTLLTLSPLLSLVEGYAIYELITRTSRAVTAHIEDNEVPVKLLIILISASSLLISAYLNVVYIDLPPSTKVIIFGLMVVLLIVNIAKEEGVVSDVCVVILVSYIVLTAATLDTTTGNKMPTFSGAGQAKTMLGAIVRIPHIISYSVSSLLPYLRQLLSPIPLSMLAIRIICVASFTDKLVEEESWCRGLGKFLVVTLYTSYVLGATQTIPWLATFTGVCRAGEVVVLVAAYLCYLLGDGQLEEYWD